MSSPVQAVNNASTRRSARPERRRARRQPVVESGLVAVTLDRHNGGILLDVSESGACVQAVSPLPAGSTVELAFPFPPGELRLAAAATVRWCDSSSRAGLSFAVPPATAPAFSAWIAALGAPAEPAHPAPTPDPLAVLLENLRRRLAADGVAVALGGRDQMTCRASTGSAPPLGARLDPDSGLSGECVRTGRPLRCEDSQTDPRVDADLCRRINLRSALIVPVFDGEQVSGVLEAFFSLPRSLPAEEVARMEVAAAEVARLSDFSPQPAPEPAPPPPVTAVAAPVAVPDGQRPTATVRPPERQRLTQRPALSRSFMTLEAESPDLRGQRIGIAVAAVLLLVLLGGALWFRPQPRRAAPAALPATATQPAAPVELSQPPAPAPPPAAAVAQKPAARPTTASGGGVSEGVSGEKVASVAEEAAEPLNLLDREVPDAGAAEPPVVQVASAPPISAVLTSGVRVPSLSTPVSTGLAPGRLIRRVEPEYPAAARAARLGGTVRLRAIVRPDGTVGAVQVDEGNPILAKAARAAVQQWLYQPYRLNDQPVAVEVEVTVNFKRP